MKKNKRIVSLIISASVAAMPLCAFAGDISCSISERNITLSGNIDTGDAYISGMIMPKVMANVEISSEDIMSGDIIAFSTEKNGDAFSKSLGLPAGFGSGEYVVCVYENTDKITTGFIYSGDDLNALSAQMDGMTDEQIYQAVSDNRDLLGIPEEYCEDFAAYVTASGKSLKEAYSEAIVVCIMKSGDIESAVRLYGEGYGIDYETGYNVLKESVKNALAGLIKTESITNLEADYDRLLKEAVLSGIETKDELREFVLSLDADFDDYNKLGDSGKKSVINKLFNNMPDNVDLLTEQFEAYSAEALSDVSSSSGSGGGGGGGSSGGRGSGGGAAAGSHLGTVSGISQPQTAVTFGDITSHWAKEYIESLSSQKIVSGYENGMFYPDRNVTRAEFSKMVAVALGIAPDTASASSFRDVSDTDWHKPYVTAMAKMGIITGYDGYFSPDDYISREDMAVIICRALTQKGIELGAKVDFDDISMASHYAVDAIARLGGSKIINGSDNKYRPKAMSTRAETAAVIARILTAF